MIGGVRSSLRLVTVGADMTSAVATITAVQIGITVLLTVTVMFLIGYRLLHRYADEPDPTSEFVRTRGTRTAGERQNGHTPHLAASPPDALTDEHRVLHLLESNGGQLPQSTIVAETEWSKSKISRLLSKMEDQCQIKKVSRGRENLIVLPEAHEHEL